MSSAIDPMWNDPLEYIIALESIETYLCNKDELFQKTHSARENCQKLYSRISEFHSAEKYTDVKIVCQNQIFKCHRFVLAAASEYFDKMFSNCFRESRIGEVPLHDIDAATFEQILAYAYKGEVKINDLNVYSLLCASEMLGLNFIEDRCIQYLTEDSTIPLSNALEIFSFACRTQNKCLIRVTSQFLLEHLHIFSKNCEFLKIPFDELRTCLEYCPPLSSKRENLMLETLLRWVRNSNCTREDKKITFVRLVQTAKLQRTPPAQIVEYFDRNFMDESDAADSYLNIEIKVRRPNLCVYVRDTLIKENLPSRTYLYTMQKGEKDVDWCVSHLVEPDDIDFINVGVLDDYIYCFKSQRKTKTFQVCSSVNLSPDLLLTLPPISHSSIFTTICCDMNNLYLYNYTDFSKEKDIGQLLVYSNELDNWSSISFNMENVYFPALMCDLSRIYLIGGYTGETKLIPKRYMQSYDQRVGKWEQLPQSRLGHHFVDSACVHKGNIYVDSRFRHDVIEIYDVAAGKWDAIRTNHYHPKKLLSFNNKLFTFYCDPESFFRVSTYNSSLQEWNSLSEIAVERPSARSKGCTVLSSIIF